MAAKKKSAKRKTGKRRRRGGARPGAGRKPARERPRPHPVTVWMTESDREALEGFATSVGEPPALALYDLLEPALQKVAKLPRKKRPREKRS